MVPINCLCMPKGARQWRRMMLKQTVQILELLYPLILFHKKTLKIIVMHSYIKVYANNITKII